MKEMLTLTKRTIKVYLKNPLSLIFSFVYMVLLIVLLTMFLGDYMTNSMKEIYGEVQGIGLENMRWLIDSTTMAGVLMINCVLVPLNVLAIMVQDSTDKRLDSFLVTSVSRDKLVFGYWLAPFIIGSVLNVLCLYIMQGFIVMNGGGWLDGITALKMCGLIVANVFSSTSIFFLVAMLMKNANVYNTATGIVSALVGFITGVFIPLGVFPEHIKKVFSIIPAHHGATLMREVMTEAPLSAVFGNVPDQTVKGTFMTAQEIVDIYAAENGINYVLDGNKVSFSIMLAVVIGSGILFLVISIFMMKRAKRRD